MKMMNYSEFKEMVKDEILSHLPKEYQDAEILTDTFYNSNGRYEGMCILRKGQSAAPILNLKGIYSEYRKTPIRDWILENIAEVLMENDVMSLGLSEMPPYEKVKDSMFIRLTNLQANKELLETVPYKQVEDLAVTYHVRVHGDDPSLFYSFMITNQYMKYYGITPEQLHKDAVSSSMKVLPPTLYDIRDMFMNAGLRSMYPDTTPMYVLSNELSLNGASAIMYDHVRETAAAVIGGSYYALPASVNEFILVRKEDSPDPRLLFAIVNSVNKETVPENEKLSDSVYFYDAEKHSFSAVLKPSQAFEKELKNEQAALTADLS